jgi:hypothetical protein
MDDRRKADAIAATRREIARRIARFCTSFSPEEFDKLLDRMAHVQWKYEVFPLEGLPDPASRPSEASTKPNKGAVS